MILATLDPRTILLVAMVMAIYLVIRVIHWLQGFRTPTKPVETFVIRDGKLWASIGKNKLVYRDLYVDTWGHLYYLRVTAKGQPIALLDINENSAVEQPLKPVKLFESDIYSV